jgi:hypothetical protein
MKTKVTVLVEKLGQKDMEIRKLIIQLNELKEFKKRLEEMKKAHE